MRRFYAVASLMFALGPMLLTGCEDSPIHWDPLAINGRDGGGKPLDYDGLMRIAAAAHAGGDLASAVAVYRRAASLNTHSVAPFVGLGNALLEMNNVDEAIVAYNSALDRSNQHDPEALRGLARAYLSTGRPELAGHPLALAYKETPNDPKLLQLIGVADDYAGQHEEAQARYRRGLELQPGDTGLSMDLALSLTLTGNYHQAIAVLRPVALDAPSTPQMRQTLALIYGLLGDRVEAGRIARLDLDPQSVQHNLEFYDSLRRLSPEARAQAVKSLSTPANQELTTTTSDRT